MRKIGSKPRGSRRHLLQVRVNRAQIRVGHCFPRERGHDTSGRAHLVQEGFEGEARLRESRPHTTATARSVAAETASRNE